MEVARISPNFWKAAITTSKIRDTAVYTPHSIKKAILLDTLASQINRNKQIGTLNSLARDSREMRGADGNEKKECGVLRANFFF